MGTATNVRVGVTGGAYHAPLGTDLPTDATATLDVLLEDVGYIGEDGVTETIGANSTDIRAWGGDTVRKVQTSHDVTYALTMIEVNDETQRVFYADETATVAEVHVTGAQTPRESWVLVVLDGDHTARIVLPDAQVTERGEVAYRGDQAVSYPITLTAYPDESGVKAYIYRDTESA